MRKSVIFFSGDGIPVLVTFRSKAWGNITMFADDAMNLLKLFGHSGSVPGALLAADIPAALARLEQKLAVAPDEKPGPDIGDTDDSPPVGLRLRAYPLQQLLIAAAGQQCDVIWEQNRSTDLRFADSGPSPQHSVSSTIA